MATNDNSRSEPAQTDPPRSRLASTLKRGAIALCSLGVALLLLEFGIRAFTNTEPPFVRRDPTVGITFVPNLDRSIFDQEAQRSVHVRTNSLGFRCPEFSEARDDDTTRIAILGDSMVAGVQVDEQHTAAARLAVRLGAETQRPLDVLNFGVNGSSTSQELVLYREVVGSADPDVVVCVYFVGNDLADNSRKLTSAPRIYFELDDSGELVQQPYSLARSVGSSWLNMNSRLYVWQKLALRRTRTEARAATPQLGSGTNIFDPADDEVLVEAWDLSEALLHELHTEVIADGRQFLVVIYPSAISVHEDQWEDMLTTGGASTVDYDQDLPSSRLANICERNAIPCIDLTQRFREAAAGRDSHEANLFLNGSGHFTEQGHDLASLGMAEHLLDAGYLEVARSR